MQAAVVGVPGTGKTFFMVSYLKKYFIYDKFFREYTISKDVLIITNIAGLKFYGASCWDIESPEILGDPPQGIKGKYTREEFFTVSNMESIMKKTGKKNIILCLDEVQRDHYFPLGYKDPDVLFLFAYHRHIGMDIILGTQDAALMARGVLAQCEYLAHGTPRSKKLLGAMSYNFTDNKGHAMYGKTLRADKAVFQAYQSATVDEVNKPKNAILHWMIVGVVFLLVAGGLFKTALAMVANKAKPKNQVVNQSLPLNPNVATGVPLHGSYSASRVPMPPVVQVPLWREYEVQGYIRDGGREYYLIRGHFVDSVKCRSYSARAKTVEYFSLEPLADSGATSRSQPTGILQGEEFRRKAETLGGAYTPLNLDNPPSEYVSKSNLSLKPL